MVGVAYREPKVLDEAKLSEDPVEMATAIQRYTIRSYGADYPIDSLWSRLRA